MLDAATSLVVDWLKTAANGCDVIVAAPGTAEGPAAVLCHFSDLSPGERRPTRSRHVAELSARYLVTARAPDARQAHALLGMVAEAALAQSEFRPEFALSDPAMWLAYGVAPRPGFFLHVPVRPNVSSAKAPLVASPTEVRLKAMINLHGRVVGPGQRGLANAKVTLPALNRSTRTNEAGEFRFSGLAAGSGPSRLMIEKGNLSRFADVEINTESVLIEFNP